MESSRSSQQLIHDWDRKFGLRRAHSKTMRESRRSRKRVLNFMRGDKEGYKLLLLLKRQKMTLPSSTSVTVKDDGVVTASISVTREPNKDSCERDDGAIENNGMDVDKDKAIMISAGKTVITASQSPHQAKDHDNQIMMIDNNTSTIGIGSSRHILQKTSSDISEGSKEKELEQIFSLASIEYVNGLLLRDELLQQQRPNDSLDHRRRQYLAKSA